jgi:crossover junction endonuclease EME1
MFLDRTFCMDAGQVKSGSDIPDTFHKMLQHIPRVTPGVADAIMSVYRTPPALIRAFRAGGAEILVGLNVGMTKAGGIRRTGLGVALSKRIYDAFLGRDQFALA